MAFVAALLAGCGGGGSSLPAAQEHAFPLAAPAGSPFGATTNSAGVADGGEATSTVIAIDCGGGTTGQWLSDRDYSAAKSTASKTKSGVATSGVSDPAPQAVYQTQRYAVGAMTYTIPALKAGTAYTVRLHFAEIYFKTAGERRFDVNIEGARVLSNFDVVAKAGGPLRAVVESFKTSADRSGRLAITFTPVTNNPIINGIEILAAATAKPTPTPTATLSSARLDALLPPTPVPTGIYEPSPPDIALSPVVLPTPFDPSAALGGLGKTDLPNLYAQFARKSELRAFRARRFSSAPPGDHEAYGLFTNLPGLAGPLPYNALYAVETGYEISQRPIAYPAGVTGLEQAFYPTIHMGWNSSCLEDSTYYRDDNLSDRSSHFTVYDFCLAGADFIFDTPITSAFVAEYEGRLPTGQQAYVVETFTPDVVPGGTSTWYTLLYNFAKRRWDVMISINAQGATTSTSNAFGWNIVEPYFTAGTCPGLAPSGSAVVSYHNSGTGGWDQQGDTMAGGLSVQIATESPACITAGTPQPATLFFQLQKANYNWIVTAPH